MASDALSTIRRNPMFRTALFVPTLIMFVFGFFNLTSTVDQRDAAAVMTLGIVNLDEGFNSPIGLIKISETLLEVFGSQLPFGTRAFEADADGREALEQGKITALILIPADFSTRTVSGEQISVGVVRSDHLSLAEAQLSRALPGQIQSGFALGVTLVRQSLAQGVPPNPAAPLPVTVETEVLHAAPSDRALASPFILVFPLWLKVIILMW